MVLDYFRGDGRAGAGPTEIESHVITDQMLAVQTLPEGYRLVGESGAATVTAVNVALVLRTPLLVSGEPGSGKTQLAYAIAHELGRTAPIKFVTKSTSQARDLLYTYDAVQHFRASQTGASADPRDYIEYSALGLAILIGLPLDVRRRFMSPSLFDDKALEPAALGNPALRQLVRAKEPHQVVLLIDEIDKAPRDFPNDVLHELETMTFRAPELGGLETPQPAASMRPIVIITTNAERPLPEAFLRRCVYTHLTYPTGEALESILRSRLEGLFRAGAPLVRDVQSFFEALRAQQTLEKDPGVAELIQFLQSLAAAGADPERPLQDQMALAMAGVSVLGKTQQDQQRLSSLLGRWTSPADR